MLYIVTVKQPKNKDHNPHDKKTGSCGYSDECTDVTGEHHSFVVDALNVDVIKERMGALHITRIEKVVSEVWF